MRSEKEEMVENWKNEKEKEENRSEGEEKRCESGKAEDN